MPTETFSGSTSRANSRVLSRRETPPQLTPLSRADNLPASVRPSHLPVFSGMKPMPAWKLGSRFQLVKSAAFKTATWASALARASGSLFLGALPRGGCQRNAVRNRHAPAQDRQEPLVFAEVVLFLLLGHRSSLHFQFEPPKQ